VQQTSVVDGNVFRMQLGKAASHQCGHSSIYQVTFWLSEAFLTLIVQREHAFSYVFQILRRGARRSPKLIPAAKSPTERKRRFML
jgi:hypothetical protein